MPQTRPGALAGGRSGAVKGRARHVRIIAVRDTGPDAYGKSQMEAVLAARFARAKLVGVQWATADASRVVYDTADRLHANLTGRTRELSALDLTAEPDLAAVLAAFEPTEITR